MIEPERRAAIFPKILFRRWAPEILLTLASAPARQRFNRLMDAIPGISDRVLTLRLRELGEVGLVSRTVAPGPPVIVTYRLTADGERVVPGLQLLAELGGWLSEDEAARL